MRPAIEKITDAKEYAGLLHVFRDRIHAGQILADMLSEYRNSGAIVIGIPAGGVPVAAVLARELGLALDIAIVKKVTPPDNTEYGYGALAWDGTIEINRDAVANLGLDEDAVAAGIRETRAKIDTRVRQLRKILPAKNLQDHTVILVDDGLATGVTYRTAVVALRKLGVTRIIGAVPTAFERSARKAAEGLDELYCANLRSGFRYAVADAYQKWNDVSEQEVVDILKQYSD